MKLERLVELRLQHDLTQEEVAQIINTARSTYNGYETGRSEMDYTTLIKIADFYKVSLDYLFSRTDNPIHNESYTADEIEFMQRSLELYRELKEKY